MGSELLTGVGGFFLGVMKTFWNWIMVMVMENCEDTKIQASHVLDGNFYGV